jgi:uncharacterized membrane protein
MHSKSARKLLREPVWFVALAALVVGAVLGVTLAREPMSDTARIVFGRAWRADLAETRAVLTGMFGVEITILSLVLSLNSVVMKGAAYQYSPRLVPIYVKGAPIRRSLPMFVLLAAYLLAAARELGLIQQDAVRPRFVVSMAVFLMIIALVLLFIDLLRTFRFVRIERVLGLARDATYAAAKRVQARVGRRVLDASATLRPPPDASALVAREPGYLVDVDLERLARLAEGAGLRVRFDRTIGDYVDAGDVIGWAAADDGTRLRDGPANDLVSTLAISAEREIDYDPALGIRVIVDIANRALSSSANDPYSARQALNQLRSVLRHVGRLPLGDWNVVDRDGSVRVSVMGTHLRDLLSIAVGGPLYYGADHPDVLEGLLDIVHEVGWIARDPQDRSAARSYLERIDGLAERSDLDPGRLARLRAEAEPVRRALATEESPPPPG